MAGQFTDFRAYINRYGVAKTSHFTLSVPIVLKGASGAKFSDLNKLLGLRCEATELPGRQLLSNDSRTYGPTYKTPYQSLYQELTVNFLETSTFLIREFFEAWMSTVFNPVTNQLEYPGAYRYPITLTQYDVMPENGDTPNSTLVSIAEWKMHNAFPTAVNQMPVAWAEDGLHRTTVSFAYEWYTLSTGPGASGEAAKTNARIKSPTIPPRGSAVS